MNDSLGLLKTISVSLPAAYQNLSEINSYVEPLLDEAVPEKDKAEAVYQIRLAVHEVCTNIIDHAYQGQLGLIKIKFSLLTAPLRMVVDLWDDGTAFDPLTISFPDLEKAHTSGYGLFLIYQLMDEVSYELLHTQNHWRLTKCLTASKNPEALKQDADSSG